MVDKGYRLFFNINFNDTTASGVFINSYNWVSFEYRGPIPNPSQILLGFKTLA